MDNESHTLPVASFTIIPELGVAREQHCDLQGFLYLLVFISHFLISRIHNPYGMY